jgi:hypothetical protein
VLAPGAVGFGYHGDPWSPALLFATVVTLPDLPSVVSAVWGAIGVDCHATRQPRDRATRRGGRGRLWPWQGLPAPRADGLSLGQLRRHAARRARRCYCSAEASSVGDSPPHPNRHRNQRWLPCTALTVPDPWARVLQRDRCPDFLGARRARGGGSARRLDAGASWRSLQGPSRPRWCCSCRASRFSLTTTQTIAGQPVDLYWTVARLR